MCSTEHWNKEYFAKALWAWTTVIFYYYLFFSILKVKTSVIFSYLIMNSLLDNISTAISVYLIWMVNFHLTELKDQNGWLYDTIQPRELIESGRFTYEWEISCWQYFGYLPLKKRLWEKIMSWSNRAIQDRSPESNVLERYFLILAFFLEICTIMPYLDKILQYYFVRGWS